MAPAMAPSDRSVAEYLAGIRDANRRADADTLIELMTDITGEPPIMWGTSIVGFGSYHYRYATGREGDAPLAAFAARTRELVLYLVTDFEHQYGALLERLGPHRTGKSCLYLKRLGDAELGVVRTLVAESARAARDVERESPGGG